jgi:hypothetical protein
MCSRKEKSGLALFKPCGVRELREISKEGKMPPCN